MGKSRPRFNEKARKSQKVLIETPKESIRVELTNKKQEHIITLDQQDSNTYLLPSEKRKTKILKDKQAKQDAKKLTKKQRKQLEKVLDRKEKTKKHDELLKQLSQVQVRNDELKLYSSIRDIGKKEKRRHDDEINESTSDIEETNFKIYKTNSIKGSNKKIKKHDDDAEESVKSMNTDEYSTDDDINDEEIEKALKKSELEDVRSEHKHESRKEEEDDDDLMPKDDNKNENIERKSTYVHVERTKLIQESRSKLPIITEEQQIMDKIFNNYIVIICGETGSGKTTQVPQFLYEAGFALNNKLIGVTEPRRVAAISMSKRVANEMNLTQEQVSYQIRYETTYSSETQIKFMTDGVLLREIQMDFLLSRYSVLILDEAHERSVFTDILIGLLSRIVPLRAKKGDPLRLIIMSATLRVQDFTENTRLFKTIPPVINVQSRQYSVSIHFNKHTYDDYLAEAYRKTCKIHRKLPEGGILVFVTGQQEVQVLCKKLRNTFPMRKTQSDKSQKMPSKFNFKETPKINLDNYSSMPLDEELDMLDDNRDTYDIDSNEGDLDVEDEDEDEEGFVVDTSLDKHQSSNEKPLYVLPLYSLLSSDKQMRIFDAVPENCRLCVISTNVAETSLTIPNIKYVVDTGKTKQKYYDKLTGVSTFKIEWTSKASAEQRAGRAGRTGPGHCYRLYSSAVYNDEFKQFSEPEVIRKPVEDLVLQMKDLGIDRLANFPFPTPPDENTIKSAENLLVSLGALKVEKGKSPKDTITRITPLGKTMACFPVNPRFSKMLTLANQHNLLAYVITMISGLSVQELLVEDPKYAQLRSTWVGTGESLKLGDIMTILIALGAADYEGVNSNKFCEQNGIRTKAIIETRKLRKQLTDSVNSIFPLVNVTLDPRMKPPTQDDAKLLRQIFLSGMVDKIAKKYEHTLTTKDGKELKNAYQGIILEEPVFIHPQSVLFKELPSYVCFVDLIETSKMYMKGVCAIEDTWMPIYLSNQCSFNRPDDEPNTHYDKQTDRILCYRKSTFGKYMWSLPSVEVEYPECVEKYKWFANFFLNGDLFDNMIKYKNVLLASPNTMLKSWAKLQPRTEALLNSLVNKQCVNKEKLIKIWENEDKNCKFDSLFQ
jgi:ATP-dependent RNA helicase DHX37/DHR1